MISMRCANCGQGLRLPDKHVGKRGKCPNCGHVILIRQGADPGLPPTQHNSAESSARKLRSPLLGWILLGMMVMYFAGFLLYMFVLRDTWEHETYREVLRKKAEAESLIDSHRYREALATYEEIFALIGDRPVKSEGLMAEIEHARYSHDHAEELAKKQEENELLRRLHPLAQRAADLADAERFSESLDVLRTIISSHPKDRVVDPALRHFFEVIATRKKEVERLLAKEERLNFLIKQLSHADVSARRCAAEVLGKAEDGRAIRALVGALDDNNDGVQACAAKALAQIGNAAFLPVLSALEHGSNIQRRRAAEILGELRASRAIEPLIGALDDSDEAVQVCAAKALTQIGNAAIPALLSVLEDGSNLQQKRAAEVLGNIGDQRAVPALIDALAQGYPALRQQAARGLGDLKDNVAVPALIAAMQDKDVPVRVSAAEALGKIRDRRAIQALQSALHEGDESIRRCAAVAYAQIVGSRGIPVLINEMKFWDSGPAAAYALEQLNWEPESIEEKVRFLVSKRERYALLRMYDHVQEVLREDLSFDLCRKSAVRAFIFLGKTGVEGLIQLLETTNDVHLAETLLNSESPELRKAAADWAKRHKYILVPQVLTK